MWAVHRIAKVVLVMKRFAFLQTYAKSPLQFAKKQSASEQF